MSEPVRPSLVSVRSFLRGLPLFFRAVPGTPLRVLAIMAFDTLHRLRTSQPLPRKRIAELAMLLGYQACTNAEWDDKTLCEARYRALRHRLEQIGRGSSIEEYRSRLRELESRRPSVGGDHRRFDEVRLYREDVARLSLATATAIALDTGNIGAEIRATQDDRDLNALFRIVMQCQIIDDVLDYSEDQSKGLPSFLTACASLRQSMELTVQAARDYGAGHERATGAVFPLRMALRACTAVTSLVGHVANPQDRSTSRRPHGRRLAGHRPTRLNREY